jgi:fructan beta-fructosidase
MKITRSGEGDCYVTLKANQPYLLLPMEDKGNELKMSVQINGSEVSSYIIRPAVNKIDYWLPLDLSKWQNQNIALLFSNLSDTSLFVRHMKLSDQFNFDVNEPYRPLYHFSPPYGWINDPNGMVYYNGEYHLCYQYNPLGTRWQNMSWGHAVSSNLITWEHRSIALGPDSLGTIFSGSAVVDHNNTAGFQVGDNKTLLAFFTHAEKHGQFQSLAYSNDNGRSWHKYAKNPILRHETAPDFRDPKVFWHNESKRWIMILAVGQQMEIYSSSNAIKWNYESSFGEGHGAHGGVWECPDLFELPIDGNQNQQKWVLICNINPGGPAGGSGTQYFIGSFDGKTFVNEGDAKQSKWLDYGKDHYAAVTWDNVPDSDGRRLAIAWMSNWEYANDVPTTHFRSAMTVARELKLIKQDGKLLVTSYPVREVDTLRKTANTFGKLTVDKDVVIDSLLPQNNGAYEINLNINASMAEIIGLRLFNTKGEYVDLSINLPEKKMLFDRTASGKTDFSPTFKAVTEAPIAKRNQYTLRLLIDKASIECFEGKGAVSMTNLVFPSEPYNRICFYSKGGEYQIEDFKVYPLQ